MKSRPASVPFIFATIFLDSLGIGLIMPVLPDLIRQFSDSPEFVSHSLGLFMSIYALMQFVFSPILGRLSDRFGRRPILLASLLGGGLDYVVMALAPSLSILFVGRMISGMTGASYTVATAYMADISDDSNRSANFGMIGAAFGLGFIVGPALGGAIGHFGLSAPFLAAAALNLLNFVFGAFVLPESLAPQNRRAVEWRQINPFASIQKVFRTPGIGLLVCVFVLLYLAGNVHPSVWTLYTETKFGWTPLQVGMSLAFVGLLIAGVQGGLTRVLIPKWGEYKSLVIGVTIGAIGFASLAFATEGWMVYALLIPNALQGISGPALQSLVTKQVPADQQGELQGSLVGLVSVTAIAAPIMYTALFAQYSSPRAAFQFVGMPYLVAGLICASSLILIWLARPAAKQL